MNITVAPTEKPTPDSMSGVNLYGLIGICVFYVLILVIGLWAGRRTFRKKEAADSTEVFLADRSIGVIVGSITLTATWVGGGYINGSAEILATPGYGLVWCQAPVCYGISLIIGGIFFAKTMRTAEYVTMLDPLQQRFGNRMGGILFLPALVAETFWSAAVLSALGSSLQVILGLDQVISVVLSACVAVFYTMLGGLYSVAYTDVVQLALIPIGLWLAFPFALNHPAVTNIAKTKDIWLGTYDVSRTGNYVDSALLLIMGGIPWQAYFQRILACKTPNGARVVSIIGGFGCFIMAIPAVLIGAVAASTDWNQTAYNRPIPNDQYKLVLPLVMQYLCPVWVSFIGLGAVSAAVMSSADSSILSASSLFARNVWKLVFRQKATEREVIIVTRAAVFFVGALAAAMGIAVKSVYSLWYLSSDLVYVILFPQLTMVLYNQTVNTYGSVCAYVVAVVLRFLGGDHILGIPALTIYPYYDEATGTQLFPFKTLTMLLSLIVLILISYFTKFLFIHAKLPLTLDIFKCFQENIKGEAFTNFTLDPIPMKTDVKYPKQKEIMKGPVY